MSQSLGYKYPVTHRIGGLEKISKNLGQGAVVTHRIGGLEKSVATPRIAFYVTHRIGGLEKYWHVLLFLLPRYTPHRWLRNCAVRLQHPLKSYTPHRWLRKLGRLQGMQLH